jgi:hypothetical protein
MINSFKNQIRKIYDIIKLKETNRSDKECYKNYRLMVKRKIYYNYKSHLETLNKEEKLFLLDQLYKELEVYILIIVIIIINNNNNNRVIIKVFLNDFLGRERHFRYNFFKNKLVWRYNKFINQLKKN